MELETWIDKQEDSVLWNLLADIGNVAEKTKASEFWIMVAKLITTELDKRLLVEYEGNEEQ